MDSNAGSAVNKTQLLRPDRQPERALPQGTGSVGALQATDERGRGLGQRSARNDDGRKERRRSTRVKPGSPLKR